jgi:glycosyltransferase involved in cell wall biosynthesis
MGESLGLPRGLEILFLANALLPVEGFSGGDKHFLEVASCWKSEGGDVSVMTPRSALRVVETEGFPGPFVLLPLAWTDRFGIVANYLLRSLAALTRLPWGRSPVLLYGTSDFLPDVLPAFIARVAGKRSVHWVNCVFHLIPRPRERGGMSLTNLLSYRAQRISLRLIRKRADLVIVDNSTLRDELHRMGFAASRVFVTAMGSDAPEVLTKTPPRYDACFLGRLHPTKGIYDLVDIWARVCEERPSARLAVVGGGPEPVRESLEERVRATGLSDRVDLLGYLPRGELEDVLSSSAMLVLPSYEEGFGISLLEAMGRGLPAVAYELPHYREIFGDSLITSPRGDTGAFSREVIDLLGDEELLEAKSREARRLALSYSWESVARREASAIAAAISKS